MKQDFALLEHGQFSRFPEHRLKRVDTPTTHITENVQRIDSRENAFSKAERGDYGAAAQREQNRPKKEPLIASQLDIITHLACIRDNEMAFHKAPISEDPYVVSRHIKGLGYYLGADIVGICRVPEYAVYSFDHMGDPIDIDYPFALVIVMGKDYRTVNASTGCDWIVDSISFQAYQRAALAAHTIARYIGRLGYRASPQHVRRYRVLVPPLLLWAGIGEVSRTGIILNPFLGLNYKAAVVLTDLPLLPDKPIDFGLQDFCKHCGICAEMCPAKAIPTADKVMYNGYETWKLDEQRCGTFFLTNKKGAGCGRCVKVCPFTRPTTWPHNMVRWLVSRFCVARRLAIKADHIIGRGDANERERWWFDLEEVDGVLSIPQ
ncbi:MAG TPA: reductive dehalogenase [Desulfatiglandales bacterium]|nr:reductive dehalogenase [Desulfatiglandales bacterium]